MLKSAISAPTLTLGHQMVPYTARMLQSAIAAPTITLDHQMVSYTARLLKTAYGWDYRAAVGSVAKVWDFPIIDGFSRDYISNNK